MEIMKKVQTKIDPRVPTIRQKVYAEVMDLTTKIGIILLIVTFTIYILNILPQNIPVSEIHNYWTMSLHQYLKITHTPIGWGWVTLLGKGDFVSYLGIVFLGCVSLLCYIRILRLFIKNKNYIYIAISSAEIIILLLSISGIIIVGRH